MSQEKILFNADTSELIAAGEIAEIYKSIHLNQTVAVKMFTFFNSSDDLSNVTSYAYDLHSRSFQNEVEILKACDSPYIVKYIGSDTESYLIAMEYCANGSLGNYLYNNEGFLPWYFVRWEIALGIGKGMAYLHAKNIIHGDLKSANVLLDENYQVKICDFGSARREHDTSEKRTSFTMGWNAPELSSLQDIATKYSDVYSYGVVLCEIASRKPPPDTDEWQDLVVFYRDKFSVDCSEGYKKWAIGCLSSDPYKRPLMKDLLRGLEEEKESQINHYYQDSIQRRFRFFSWDVLGQKACQLGRSFRLNQCYKNATHYLKKAINVNYLPAYLDLYLIYTLEKKPKYVIEERAYLTQEECINKVASNFEWFKAEAKKGSGEALYNLAKCYELGWGLPSRDPDKALQYYRLAAQKNYPVAQYDLAEYYLKPSRSDGCLFNQDLKESERYFILAANQGLGLAQFRLGECYEQGLFGDANKGKAMDFYHQAAEGGNLMALIKLGAIYEEENKQHPNMQSLERALKMYTLASKEGFEEAVKKVMFLSELMKVQKVGIPKDYVDSSKMELKDNETFYLCPLTT